MNKNSPTGERSEQKASLQRAWNGGVRVTRLLGGETPRSSARVSAKQFSAEANYAKSGFTRERADIQRADADTHLVSLFAPTTFAAEQYRTVCHRLKQLRVGEPPTVIAISSPGVGDGKTTTAINLAGALGQYGETQVLLIDMDLRRPTIPHRLGVPLHAQPGLAELVVTPHLSLHDVVQPSPLPNLSFLTAGQDVIQPHVVLQANRLGVLLEEARRQYDYVVLDLPPLLPFPDARLVDAWIDGFVLVVAAHKTSRKLLEKAVSAIDPAKLIGILLNNNDDGWTSGESEDGDASSSYGKEAGWRLRLRTRIRTFFRQAPH